MGSISIVSTLRSCFLASVDSGVSLRFSVPVYGVKPSFSSICFFTHGRVMNLAPPPCPVKTLPFRMTGFNRLSSFNSFEA